jgi:hypothetical protein
VTSINQIRLKNLLPFMFDKNSCKKNKKTLLILLLDGMSYFATRNLCEETLLRYRY